MFVQFMHPGSEHQPTSAVMAWNRRSHARKFMVADGQYLADGAVHDGALTFWGEWEPQSRVIETFPAAGNGPGWLHEPFWERPRHRQLLQNTDPLVFGETFLYTNCLQWNSKLRRLAPGSIVLFGSKLSGRFVLDTVFVVGDRGEPYTRGSALAVQAPDWVRAVLFEPLAASAGPPHEPFRRYSGRMHADGSDGPFSFVPCRPYRLGQVTFERPTIELDGGWIDPSFGRGARAKSATHRDLLSIWERVVAQVTTAGLSLGVSLEAPPEASVDSSGASA